eukprot:c25276_g2_i1 orf=42-248(-)
MPLPSSVQDNIVSTRDKIEGGSPREVRIPSTRSYRKTTITSLLRTKGKLRHLGFDSCHLLLKMFLEKY